MTTERDNVDGPAPIVPDLPPEAPKGRFVTFLEEPWTKAPVRFKRAIVALLICVFVWALFALNGVRHESSDLVAAAQAREKADTTQPLREPADPQYAEAKSEEMRKRFFEEAKTAGISQQAAEAFWRAGTGQAQPPTAPRETVDAGDAADAKEIQAQAPRIRAAREDARVPPESDEDTGRAHVPTPKSVNLRQGAAGATLTAALNGDLGQALPTPRVEPPAGRSGALAPPMTMPVAQATSNTIQEGYTIDTMLMNQINGSSAGPIRVRVTQPIPGYDGRLTLIPQGATIIGWVTPVGSVYDSRLTVAFHKLQMPPPDGRSYSLDQFKGLNQIGEVGLRDKVNNHYVEKFGMAAAIGFITAIPQAITNASQSRNSNTSIMLGGGMGGSAQLSQQMFQQAINRPPDLVQRPGDRVKVHVANDITLPAWGIPK